MTSLAHKTYKEENHLDNVALHDMYDEMLDEVYGEVKIAGLSYDTSSALKEIDYIAYRCGFNDWLDAEIQDGNLFQDEETHEIYSNAEEAEDEVA